MKNCLLIFVLLVCSGEALAQVPQAMNYQAVIRNITGESIIDANLTIRASIAEDVIGNTISYKETHEVVTSSLGLIDIQIGNGNIEEGVFSLIEWKDPKFLIIEIRLEGSRDFTLFGASQILSVPYALYADRVNDRGGMDLIGDDLLVHYNSDGQTDTVFLTPELILSNISISTPVCIGDSLFFDISSEAFDQAYWITPDNDTLNFQDTIFRLEENSLRSGVYKAILIRQGQAYEYCQWVTINPCVVKTQDDFLIFKNYDYLHRILENDHDNGTLCITKVDNQEVEENSFISLINYPSVSIRLNAKSNAIFISPDSSIDTLLQFTVEVCDDNGFCDNSTVTLQIDHTQTLDNDNIISKEEVLEIINNAALGDTVDFNYKTVIIQGNPLTINKALTIKNVTFKRACTSLTFLAEASSENTNTVIVKNSEDFHLNDWTLLVNGPNHLDNSSGQILSIKKINGDTIITFQSFVNPMEVGAKLIHQFPLIRMQPNANIKVTFDNVIFDGNKDCNSYTYDWRYNNTINVGAGMILQNCFFKNTPTENIFMCGGTVKESTATKLNGSFVHGSCPSSNAKESFVLDNTTTNVCQIPQSLNGHNEGWFTYSGNVRFFTISGNNSIDGGEACFGSQGLDDFSNIFTNNYFENFLRKKFNTAIMHHNEDNIDNNTFVNTPD